MTIAEVIRSQCQERGAEAVAELLGRYIMLRTGTSPSNESKEADDIRAFLNQNLTEDELNLDDLEDVPEAPPVAAGVVCNCPADFCPAHGRIDRSEAKQGRRVRS